jgi:putative MFS transporter
MDRGGEVSAVAVLEEPAVLLAASGNAGAVFALVLFGVVRVASMESFGLAGEELLAAGARILNWQMAGMLIGGIWWGVRGDRAGRVHAFLGTVALHAAASLASACAVGPASYAACRFLAGLGLAGEFGAAITLLAESHGPRTRAYATTWVAAAGMVGAVAASLAGHALHWRAAYLLAAVAGIALLVQRARLAESPLFAGRPSARRGDLTLLASSARLRRYLACIAVGLPVWFVAGILMIFAPELGSALGVGGLVAGRAILCHGLGAFAGNLAGGWLTQRLQSRKRAIAAFLFLMAAYLTALCGGLAQGAASFYALCVLSGIAAGYFGLFATLAAEQFGTNIRSTVATTVPNLVRGAVVPLTLALQLLRPTLGLIAAVQVLSGVCLALALLGLANLDETYGRDLDFVEA